VQATVADDARAATPRPREDRPSWPREEAARAEAEDMVAADALYDEVRAYLVDGRTSPDERLLAAIDTLTREHPSHALHLLRELQQGVMLAPHVAQTYSVATRRRVVAALQATLPQALASSTKADETLAAAGWPREEDAHADSAADLLAWAAGTAPWPGDEHVARAIRSLPEASLADVVRRLRPADHAPWLRDVERIATASYRTGVALPVEQLRVAKWGFLLRTARSVTGPATAHDIAQRFAGELAARHGTAPSADVVLDREGEPTEDDVLAAYALYDELRAYLVDGRAASDVELLAALETLTREHRWQALRLLRELQSGVTLSARVARIFGAATRQRVVATLSTVLSQDAALSTTVDDTLATAGWPREEPARVADIAALVAWATGGAAWPGVDRIADIVAGLPDSLLANVKRLRRAAGPGAWLRELGEVLAAQQSAAAVADTVVDERAIPIPAEVQRASELYDEIQVYLVEGRPASDQALLMAMETLTREHPWKALTLLRMLQSGVALSPRVAQTYGMATRERLVAALSAVLPQEAAPLTIANEALAAAGWPREEPSRAEAAAAQLLAWAAGATSSPSDEDVAGLIGRLSDSLLADIVRRLRPDDHASWLRVVERVTTASYAMRLTLAPASLRQIKWTFLLRAVQAGVPRVTERDIARRFASVLADHAGGADRVQIQATLMRQFNRDWRVPPMRRTAEAVDQRTSMAALRTRRQQSLRDAPERRRQPVEPDREPVIHVNNAGVVIASPYLPRLFAMLNLLGGPTFRDDAAACRAVHLLQFMVDSRTDAPEHLLVLNKILCGVALAWPIERDIEATDDERAAIEGLIRGMIQNWQKIGRTSVAGFRESFLQRGGTLRLRNDEWHLQVEPRPFDMLLDYIPWSFAVIKHPWMPQAVHVEWR
jgi:hypothetical protein